ncbi:hypothetical protein ACIO14_21445 [Nocardia fluminea]|uniref:hypothetical protein n=1 Tax=Nocardia fluminea TaxID=134984 RepID=UPI0038071A10
MPASNAQRRSAPHAGQTMARARDCRPIAIRDAPGRHAAAIESTDHPDSPERIRALSNRAGPGR